MDDNDPVSVIVFYSNYSGNCKAFMQLLKNNETELPSNIKYVCVDDTAMRREVSKKIRQVPGLVVLSNNDISLYEGGNAFDWMNDRFTLRAQSENTDYGGDDGPESNVVATAKSVTEIAAEILKSREA
jgi:thiol-disulfide isomerase/thioredoxin